MHPTTLLTLATQKMTDYRREADAQRLISEARRPVRLEPMALPRPARESRPTISARPMPVCEADC